MPLTLTYSTLISMLESWSEDLGPEFAAEVNDIIGLGELRLLRDLDLEIFDIPSTGTFSVGDNFINKPSDMVAARTLSYVNSDGDTVYLKLRTYEYLLDYWPHLATTGAPLFYTEYSSTQWMIAPTPSTTWTWKSRHIERPAGLSSTNTTTWLSTKAADALFHACLIEGWKYLKEDPISETGTIAMLEKDYASLIGAARYELRNTKRSDYKPIESTPTPSEGG